MSKSLDSCTPPSLFWLCDLGQVGQSLWVLVEALQSGECYSSLTGGLLQLCELLGENKSGGHRGSAALRKGNDTPMSFPCTPRAALLSACPEVDRADSADITPISRMGILEPERIQIHTAPGWGRDHAGDPDSLPSKKGLSLAARSKCPRLGSQCSNQTKWGNAARAPATL